MLNWLQCCMDFFFNNVHCNILAILYSKGEKKTTCYDIDVEVVSHSIKGLRTVWSLGGRQVIASL